MKARRPQGIVLVLIAVLLAWTGCGRKSQSGQPKGIPSDRGGFTRTEIEAMREKQLRRLAVQPQPRMAEGLTELFRVEDVDAVAVCADLEGDGTVRILATVPVDAGEEPGPPGLPIADRPPQDFEIRIYDLQGALLSSWRVKGTVGVGVRVVQADDDAQAEVLTDARVSGRGVLTLWATDGSVLWTHRTDLWLRRTEDADVDGDGKSEFLTVEEESQERETTRTILTLLDSDGSVRWQRSDLGIISGLQTADVDGDGAADIVLSDREFNLCVLDADGSELRRFSKKDLGVLGRFVAAADVVATSSGPEMLVTDTFYAWDEALVALAPDGSILRRYELAERGIVLAVSEFVATSAGPEILLLACPSDLTQASVKVVSGSGKELFRMDVGEGYYGRPYTWRTFDELLAIKATFNSPFLILNSRGNVVARVQGFRYSGVDSAVDGSGARVLVFSGRDGLAAYALGDE